MLGLRAIAEYPLCAIVVLVIPVPVPPPVPLPDDPPEPLPPPTPLDTVVARYGSHTFRTSVTDIPADMLIPGRLTGGIVMGRKINAGPDGQFGGLIVASFGEIELANEDGELDALADEYFIDGRVITVLAGETEIDGNAREVVKPFASFFRIYSATAGAWRVEHDKLRLTIRDAGITLQRQFQTATYGGTGGQQGTADMKGKTVPVSLGDCENVSAQQIDPVYLTYQVHDGPIQAISNVYDKGASGIAFDQNYPSYPAMVAATVPPATYATCLAGGYFRLGTTPVGTVTADVEGDKTGGTYALSHAAIIRRILAKYSWLDQTLIDESSFTNYHNQLSDGVGIFLPAGDTSTIESVIERLALSGGAIAGQDRSGLYRVQSLLPPTTPIYAFDYQNMLFIERLLLPYGVPWKKWTVHGQRNYTVQLPSDLAGTVSQSRQRFLESETRSETVNTPDVSSAHPSSSDGVRQSYLRALDKCENAAVRLATFYALRRALYRLTVKGVLFQIELGQTVRVTYTRWNLANGRNFVVVAVSDDAGTQTTDLEVFG